MNFKIIPSSYVIYLRWWGKDPYSSSNLPPSAEGHVELTPKICSEPLTFQILCLGEQKVLVSSGEIFLKSGCLWDRVFNECRSQCLCRQAWNTPLQRIPSETPFQIFFYNDTHAVNLPCTLIVSVLEDMKPL